MRPTLLIAALMTGFVALAADTGAELFQKAVTAERAAGNLEEAIRLYQRVVVEHASDRALAAKALLQEARCYEKLGQTKALKLYEQVAREYKDQREPATLANAKLAALRQNKQAAATPATMTQRRIEISGQGADSRVLTSQTDGQRRIFVDSPTGALMMGDLAGGGGRLIYKAPKGTNIGLSIASRDFSWMVMHVIGPNLDIFAAVRADGSGYREIPITLSPNWTCGPQISWDNRFVVFCRTRIDGPPELWKFSIADGALRKIGKAEGDDHIFSPDGRWLAYSDQRGKTLVMPSDGGEPHVIYGEQHDGQLEAMDWTPDGRYLIASGLVGSDSQALYLLPIKDGQRAGDPIFVRYGQFNGARSLPDGGVIYTAYPPQGRWTYWLGKLDADEHVLGWEQLRLTGSGYSSPSWSPDSTQIAYLAVNAAAGQYGSPRLRLRTIATGEERELYRGGLFDCFWSAVHPNILCGSYGPKGPEDELSISTETGLAQKLGVFPRMPAGMSPGSTLFRTRDDRGLYIATTQGLIRSEIGSPEWSKVYDGPVLPRDQPLIIASPDERWITRYEKNQIMIRPLQGGDWRPLVALNSQNQAAFTADGNWLVYHGRVSGSDGLFRIATSGGTEERLGNFPSPTRRGTMWISPDGRKVIASTVNPQEVWKLENFEPRP